MTGLRRATSAATGVVVVLLSAVAIVGALVAVLLVIDAQRGVRTEAERVTRPLAQTIATTDAVQQALPEADASSRLQPYAERVTARSGVDFITIMLFFGI